MTSSSPAGPQTQHTTAAQKTPNSQPVARALVRRKSLIYFFEGAEGAGKESRRVKYHQISVDICGVAESVWGTERGSCVEDAERTHVG